MKFVSYFHLKLNYKKSHGHQFEINNLKLCQHTQRGHNSDPWKHHQHKHQSKKKTKFPAIDPKFHKSFMKNIKYLEEAFGAIHLCLNTEMIIHHKHVDMYNNSSVQLTLWENMYTRFDNSNICFSSSSPSRKLLGVNFCPISSHSFNLRAHASNSRSSLQSKNTQVITCQ